MLATRNDLAADPLIAHWVHRGWPLIGWRIMPDEGEGVALGLPLPPFAGKRRLSFLVEPKDIVAITPPPALRAVRREAPSAWLPALDGLEALASQYSVDVMVFGSLVWRMLTGLDYLAEGSDLDVLLYVDRNTDLVRLAAGLAQIEAAAPVRLDGEFIRNDGAAVNWREIHAGTGEILVKTNGGVALLDPKLFLAAEVRP